MIELTQDTILAIIAIVISLISLAVSFYFNKRALDQAEKHTIAQITYEGKKQALSKLLDIVEKNSKFHDVDNSVDNFLKSSDAILISPSVITELLKEKGKLMQFYSDNQPYDNEPIPTDKELERMEQQGNRYYESLPLEEKFEIELSNKIDSFKKSIKGAISKELNFPIPKSIEVRSKKQPQRTKEAD